MIRVDVSSHNISGGTVVAAIQLIKDRGVDNKQIKVVGFPFLKNCFYPNSHRGYTIAYSLIHLSVDYFASDSRCRCSSCPSEIKREVPRVNISDDSGDKLLRCMV